MTTPQPEKSIDEAPTLVPGHDTSVEFVAASPLSLAAEAPTLVPPADNPAATVSLPPPASSSDQVEHKHADATRVDLAAGILGPYREVRPLKAWKSGTIYSAVHQRLRRQVELQVLEGGAQGQEIGPNLASRDAFLQTARKAAAIRHPNVETGILEAATYGDVTFVARERFNLEPLNGFGPRDRAQRRREALYPNEALAQASLEAARGLAEIHRRGLSHGQISRAVLRRGTQGQVRLAGLGVEPIGPNPDSPRPEAIGPDSVQQDIFDLGSSFAELICGSTPALGGPAGSITIRLRRLNPGLSRALAGILECCLTTDSSLRFRDVPELIRKVEKLTEFVTLPVSWGDRVASHLYDVIVLGFPIAGFFALFLWLDQQVHGLMALDFRSFSRNSGGPRVEELLQIAYFFIAVFVTYLLSETLLGWTPGRRLRGIRLLDSSGERPPRSRLLIRCLCRFAWVMIFVLSISQGMDALGRQLQRDQVDLVFTTVTQSPMIVHWLGMVFAAPVLAMVTLYLTGLCMPDRRPLHDSLSGISWYWRRQKETGLNLETVEITPKSQRAQPAPSTPSPGPVLGRMDQYELRGLLGQGAMGAVYEAFDTLLERRVAMKVLNSSIAATPVILQRFEREARLAAQLSHPNVAQVFGVGEANGQPYMVMEFVEGHDLQKHVQREGPLPLARAWEFIRQTTLALREAANHGIVHRDIKPANLMLAGSDVVKVTDFGISRAFGEEEEKVEYAMPTAPIRGDASLTKTGALLGTPMYFSPEQARGEKLDQRSDIYSLGMTFYFLLSGKPPFDSADIYDLIMCQCENEPDSLTGKVAGWTPRRDTVLKRMIAKNRAARFQDYDELLKELDVEAPRPSTLAGLALRPTAEIVNLWILSTLAWCIESICGLFLKNSTTASTLSQWLFSTLFILVYVLGIGHWGITPGKWFFRLRVFRPGKPMVGYWRAFLRVLILYPAFFGAVFSRTAIGSELVRVASGFLTIILMLISCYLIQNRPRRQGVHDIVAGTIVVRLPAQQGPWAQILGLLRRRKNRREK